MTQSSTTEKGLLTPFNVVAGIILLVGIPLIALRFASGLGVMADSDNYPWGSLISLNVMCGVALSAGGFVIGTAVYIFGMKEYKLVVREAVLTGFLGYFFVVVALTFDLGRPWRLPYPMIVSLGVSSVLFLVAWHVALYLSTQFVEFSPTIFEWRDWKRWHKVAISVTVGATIFGIVLSTLHQSALGALFLIAPTRVHPLWYSSYIPLYYLVSAIGGGLSMVIFVGWMSRRVFKQQVKDDEGKFDKVTLGLGKATCMVLAIYFAIKVIGIASGNHWHYLGTSMGHWYLVELLGFVVLPCFLFAMGYREKRLRMVRVAAIITISGIILNRINTSLIAYNWELPPEERFTPHWMEIWISITVITIGILVFRWIVSRMPVLYEHPKYKGLH